VLTSVFTPLSASGNAFVGEAYESLTRQSVPWEWVLLPNNGGKVPDDVARDKRVRVLTHYGESGIGMLKARTARAGRGDVLLELDHDDVLRDDALLRVAEAIEGGADFVYSDFCQFLEGSMKPKIFGSQYGWRSYGVKFRGRELVAMTAPEATAQALRKIEWSPNHVRAWKREAYEEVGGHDPLLEVADDHDLVLRTFLAKKRMVHVPECLYFYRVHPAQTTADATNAQKKDWRLYERYIDRLALRFAEESRLRAVDLCAGDTREPPYEPFDIALGHDLDRPWPMADSSVGVIRATDAIEHLKDPVHTMNEAYRVLAPGGFFLSATPSTDGRGAFQDPTHVSFWNENSFFYYTDRRFARFVPRITCRFQVSSLSTFFPSKWHEEHHAPYVGAHLIALKDGYHPMGEVHI